MYACMRGYRCRDTILGARVVDTGQGNLRRSDSFLWQQPGSSPLIMDDKGYVLRNHVLSASNLKNNAPGLMVSGPLW